ncbi:hypothetical protein C0995_016386 [Termitomyces sp. Mi166|nr:hypothetical protein C0995_016386 [Termitomyces sp. Mi166\
MAFQGQPGISESSKSSGGGGRPKWSPSTVFSVAARPNSSTTPAARPTANEIPSGLQATLAPEYSGSLGKGVACRLPYMQDDSADEGCYEHPQQMRSYASVVTQSVLLSGVEYAQYAHPVDEVLLQHLEQAGQPVPATAAFLQDDLAMMVVEGLLDQIELMRRQHMIALEQIECVGKRKAPTFEEPMVKPKRARAPSQRPQELVWAPACTIVQLPP